MDYYSIKVIDERGITSCLETGISKWYKPEYLAETLDYYRECNPTKQFTLLEVSNV